MTTSDKLREIAAKWSNLSSGYDNPNIDFQDNSTLLSDLTALISEDYVEKAKYDELLHQRDELKEALEGCRSRLTCSEKPNNSQKTEGGEG